MRILLCNKFYYRRGGDCIYTLNLEQLLKSHGHEVAIFAMQYPENLPSEWSGYWPTNMSKADVLLRPFGSRQVREGFSRLLDDFKPDVVHLNNIHTQLSPVIAEIAHQRGIRVVWTIHDYKLLCPRYDCLQRGRKLCDECFNDKKAVLRHSCMKNSLMASAVAYFEAVKWNRVTLESNTDAFICPSQFMADKMKQGGFDKTKLHVMCNFIDVEKCRTEEHKRENYYCFVGRLSHEKGVKTLIEAARQLPYPLIVIGGGPLESELRSLAKDDRQITFTGQLPWEEIRKLIGSAAFSTVPSEWNEPFGLVNIEAQCLGTPVLGARIGGTTELIEEGVSGMTFESGNVEDLKEKIVAIHNATFDHEQIAQEAQAKYDAEHYAAKLENLYGGGNIWFVGYCNWEEIKAIVSGARFTVIPSEWYENNPLSVIEAQCLGTPVLGAKIGGISELIASATSQSLKGWGSGCANGMTFESGNVEDLKDKIEKMWQATFDYKAIVENAIRRYSSEAYYNKLMECYKDE